MTQSADYDARRDWPVCATYPNLDCVCRGGLRPGKGSCTRKRTGDLTPVTSVTPPEVTEHVAGPTEALARAYALAAEWDANLDNPTTPGPAAAKALRAALDGVA